MDDGYKDDWNGLKCRVHHQELVLLMLNGILYCIPAEDEVFYSLT